MTISELGAKKELLQKELGLLEQLIDACENYSTGDKRASDRVEYYRTAYKRAEVDLLKVENELKLEWEKRATDIRTVPAPKLLKLWKKTQAQKIC